MYGLFTHSNEPDFQHLFKSLPGLYLVLKPDLTIVAASEAYLNATMTRREEVVGQTLFDIFPDNTSEPGAAGITLLSASLMRVLENRVTDVMDVQKCDIRGSQSEGGGFEKRCWLPVNSPVIDQENNITYIIHRVEDVTDSMRLKERVEELNKLAQELRSKSERMEADVLLKDRELDESNRLLEGAREALEQKEKEGSALDRSSYNKGRCDSLLFENLIRDLSTPLTVIQGLVERLRASRLLSDHPLRELDLVGQNTRALVKRLDDLVHVANIEAARTAVEYQDVNIAGLVRLIASHFDPLARERKIELLILGPGSLEAQVDAAKFQRVVLNLLSNAFKFTPDGGRVTCGLYTDGPCVVLNVSDSGPGIPASTRAGIFEKFPRGGASGSAGIKGKGLGLAIAKDLTEMMCGSISLEDPQEGGALFVVQLPLKAPSQAGVISQGVDSLESIASSGVEAVLEKLKRKSVTRVAYASDPHKPTVLVIENDSDLNQFVVEILASDFNILTAADGKEGLEKALSSMPDLVVVDTSIPSVSVDEIIQVVRKRTELSKSAIILIAGPSDDELCVKLLREGAQDYVLKPFVEEVLRARTHHYARSKLSLAGPEGMTEPGKMTGKLSMESGLVPKDKSELARSDFFSTIDHELRSPMTSVHASLDLMKPGKDVPARRKADHLIQIAFKNSSRMVHLISNMLDVQRIESGKMVFRLNPADLLPVIEQSVEDNKLYAQEIGVDIVFDRKIQGVRVRMDDHRIRQVLSNLFSNAIRFSPRASSIDVSMLRIDGSIRVAIQDAGPGIPDSSRTSIFEKFSVADSSKLGEVSHRGRGLWISKAIIEKHGGSIGVESSPNTGSTFYFDLPVLPGVTEFQGRTGSEVPAHILICEDDADVATLLALMLKTAGFDVKISSTAMRAKEMLEHERFDAMTLDLSLPDQDGVDFLRNLRREEATRDFPVVVVSGKTEQVLHDLRNDRLGVSEWLEKPLDQNRLTESIKKALNLASARLR